MSCPPSVCHTGNLKRGKLSLTLTQPTGTRSLLEGLHVEERPEWCMGKQLVQHRCSEPLLVLPTPRLHHMVSLAEEVESLRSVETQASQVSSWAGLGPGR